MRRHWLVGGTIVLVAWGSLAWSATSPTAEEMAACQSWCDQHLQAAPTALPFSFRYGDRSSDALAGQWQRNLEVAQDGQGTRRTVELVDGDSGLQVRCVSLQYADFPVVEWIVYVKNTGTRDSLLLEDLQALDIALVRDGTGEFILHHSLGSPDAPHAYQPLQTVLAAGTEKHITAEGGRPTNSDLCFFNVEWPGQGVIVALGWPGQWAAQFVRDGQTRLRVRAGQELTRLRLRPGEEVRTPLVALQFWQGAWIRSQNIWRRWMIAHNLPHPGGKLVPTHFGSCWGNMQPVAAEEIEQIDGWVREKIPLDYWFLDAGWYPGQGQWWNTGTWEADPARFPRGLREVSDHAHAHHMKFVCWFEPERVRPGSWLWDNRPQWLLGCGGAQGTAPQLEAAMHGDTQKLFNLGNPEARQWLIEHIDGVLKDNQIDVYRQDFNFNPLEYWRANDGPDRLGSTENAHVTGYLAYWDELLRRDPHRWIDTCASGGRRNDLETLRRAVPLLRSDYFQDPIGQQCHTYGLSLWMPYYGSGAGLGDVYLMRSSICPAYRIGCDMRNTQQDFDLLRRTVAQFRRIEPYLLGDYYPLTPYSVANDVWMAWQFDRPETGAGVVQAFRRAECGAQEIQLKLCGLEAAAQYSVIDLDRQQPVSLTGRALMDEGLTVQAPHCPGAVIVVYEKTR